ncbi:hypothetical protein ACFOVU_19430 [Nocardiopsis sediminis]|uniref:Uncharacterized protein n=1 Tax=Nocardiopsis sediminis TaxID=1778267 RepID=A0ABV8FPM3_9ACTN
MTDTQAPLDRSAMADRVNRAAAALDPHMRGSLGNPVADRVQQTPSVIGEAVVEALMTFLRGNSRVSKRVGPSIGRMAVLATAALLARALRNRAARTASEGGQIVHVFNPRPRHHVHIAVVRTARAEAADPALTEAVRLAVARHPDVPDDVKAHVAGPEGARAITAVLSSIGPDDVATALRDVKRQEALIDRLSQEWTSGLGFSGSFEDAWRHAHHNPAVGTPDQVGLAGPPQGGWRDFAGWDPATAPTAQQLDHLNAAWISSVASLEPEAADARRRIEPLVLTWEPLVFERYTRELVDAGLRNGHLDLDSGAHDRISAVEGASIHIEGPPPGSRPLNIAEHWARILTPEGLRDLDEGRIRDLVDSWSTHTGHKNGAPTALAEPAATALDRFEGHLAGANPAIGAEYTRLVESGRTPVEAFTEVSRCSTGHPFAADSMYVPPPEPAADARTTADAGARRTAGSAGRGAEARRELVDAVDSGADLPAKVVTGADYARPGAPDLAEGLASLGGKYKANTRTAEERVAARHNERRTTL